MIEPRGGIFLPVYVIEIREFILTEPLVTLAATRKRERQTDRQTNRQRSHLPMMMKGGSDNQLLLLLSSWKSSLWERSMV